jgi:hypothetical protein
MITQQHIAFSLAIRYACLVLFYDAKHSVSRSQQPKDLKRGLSSSAKSPSRGIVHSNRTWGMNVCVFSSCLCCV